MTESQPSAGPQKENGYTPIANEILEALMRTNLSPYESRFLWCIFRQTYGWGKKEDWIAIGQVVEMTGMHKSHASRTKKRLIGRHIVTQTGNQIAFNKFYTQWRELPEQATAQKVTSPGTPPPQVTPPPPPEADTSYIPKENLIKDSELPEQATDLERRWKQTVIENQWCDTHYADKTWSQAQKLRAENRTEFNRKVTLMLTWAKIHRRIGRAKLLFHEIASFVNDRGAMERNLSAAEIAKRRDFAREESGDSYVERELSPSP